MLPSSTAETEGEYAQVSRHSYPAAFLSALKLLPVSLPDTFWLIGPAHAHTPAYDERCSQGPIHSQADALVQKGRAVSSLSAACVADRVRDLRLLPEGFILLRSAYLHDQHGLQQVKKYITPQSLRRGQGLAAPADAPR